MIHFLQSGTLFWGDVQNEHFLSEALLFDFWSVFPVRSCLFNNGSVQRFHARMLGF